MPASPEREEPSAQSVRDAVLAVDGVVGLHGGVFGEVATYLSGERVTGIRLGGNGDPAEVHLVAEAGRPVLEIAAAVRAAVEKLVGRAVDVTVEDVAENERHEK